MRVAQGQRDVHERRAWRLLAGAQHATGNQQVGHDHIDADPANQPGDGQRPSHMGMLRAQRCHQQRRQHAERGSQQQVAGADRQVQQQPQAEQRNR
ncbi:hypothetical protein D3C77_658300 [compost metagenome]